MKNLENKIKAIKTDTGVLNQFSISIQIGSAMNTKDPNYFYEEFKGNKTAVLNKLKQYVNRIQSQMFEDEYSFLAFLTCKTKNRKWETTEVFSKKISLG